MEVTLSPIPDEDTAAAVLAAIACALEQDAAGGADVPARSSWRAAGVLAAQGLPGARNAANASWHAAERTRRAERWSSGVVGI
jgi:hypothetical protein